ncbi:Acetolactate synthase, mitochondrial [Arthrobotrys conoides]|uniref:Acetolactate synthase n=1 Tax=Arthrobotrys conoides TaxID=74498 RepID=A0AAN8RUB3_9PEZI
MIPQSSINLARRQGISKITRSSFIVQSTATFTSKPHSNPPTKHEQTRNQSTAAATVVPSPDFIQFPEPRIPTTPLGYPLPSLPNHAPKLPIHLPGLSPKLHTPDIRHGLDHSTPNKTNIFSVCFPGGAAIPVIDPFYDCPEIDVILPRHEQCAGHMAEGYARVSGKPGVVIVTSGPGATNMITPMQDALSDGIPLIVITGQAPTSVLGTDSFQEADIIGISNSCTKWNYMVRNVSEIPRRINEAFEVAMSGRPGPVLIDIPKDVGASILRKPVSIDTMIPSLKTLSLQSTPITRHASNPSSSRNRAFQKQQQLMESIQKSADLINIAKKPIIYAGNGVLSKPEGSILLRELAEKAQIPVTTTLHGLGCFDEHDEKSLHMLGMHGTAYANIAIQEADCIIALGARFDDRVTGNLAKFAPAAKEAAAQGKGGIIHFEIQPKNINKIVQATQAVEGDLSTNLKLMLPLVEGVRSRSDWIGRIKELKEKFPISHFDRTPASGLLNPQVVIEELSRLTEPYKDKVVITTGVGQHQMWVAQHYRWRYPRTMVTSGGLGTMGFGLPSAIGAKLAQPENIVIDIDGDASFQMTLMELKTAALYNIGIKIIIINNGEQGMVAQWQSLCFNDRFMLTHQGNPDFVTVAKGMGIKAIRVSSPDQLEAGLKTMLSHDGPILLDVITDSKTLIFPTVAPGKGLDELLLYDEEAEKKRRTLMKQRTGY